MKEIFAPAALDEIRRNICRSLTDTFQLMFQLDIYLMPPLKPDPEKDSACAYMLMTREEAKAHLGISVNAVLLDHIADILEPGVTAHASSVSQDIVNEITNIVGNHLRAYIVEKMGIEFTLSLPIPGPPPGNDKTIPAIALHFRIRENDTLSLDFGYRHDAQSLAV